MRIGGVIAALGGVVVVIATFFEMLSVTLGLDAVRETTLSRTYFDTDNGKVVAALGVVIVVLALTTLVRPNPNFVVSVVMVASSVATVALALYDRIDLDGVTDELRTRLYHGNPAPGIVQASIGPALYVAMAGGLFATIGAVLAARETSER